MPIFQRHIRAGVSFVRIRKILVNSKKIDLTNPVRPPLSLKNTQETAEPVDYN